MASKRYDEVITKKAISRSGMFRIHQIDEQYFFEIPDSLLNRDILVVNRISKAPAGLRPNCECICRRSGGGECDPF